MKKKKTKPPEPSYEKKNEWVLKELRKRLYKYEEFSATDKAILEACRGSMMIAFLQLEGALRELESQFKLFDNIFKIIYKRRDSK